MNFNQINDMITMHRYKLIVAMLTITGDTEYPSIGTGKLYDLPLLKVILSKVEDQVTSREEIDEETGVNKLARLVTEYAFDKYDEGHPDLLEALYNTCYENYEKFEAKYGLNIDGFFKTRQESCNNDN